MVCIPALENFEQFIKERLPQECLTEKRGVVPGVFQVAHSLPTHRTGPDGLRIGMRVGGLKAISCNRRIRVANAYLKWLGSPLKVSRLKEAMSRRTGRGKAAYVLNYLSLVTGTLSFMPSTSNSYPAPVW